MFQANKQSEQQLVVNKPNILDRPKKLSSAGGGGGVGIYHLPVYHLPVYHLPAVYQFTIYHLPVANNNSNAAAASGGSGAAQVDIRKLTVSQNLELL